MAINSFVGKTKLMSDGIQDMVLVVEVQRRDSGEVSTSDYSLNVDK